MVQAPWDCPRSPDLDPSSCVSLVLKINSKDLLPMYKHLLPESNFGK